MGREGPVVKDTWHSESKLSNRKTVTDLGVRVQGLGCRLSPGLLGTYSWAQLAQLSEDLNPVLLLPEIRCHVGLSLLPSENMEIVNAGLTSATFCSRFPVSGPQGEVWWLKGKAKS